MLELLRYNLADTLTQGILFVKGKYFCDTLELPWKDNERKISSIPTGVYSVQWRKDDKFPEVLEILNVPNRSGILIHSANSVNELLGCIAVGYKTGDKLLPTSRDTLKRLINLVGRGNTSITIRNLNG
jgi:hypothetical protein